MKRSVDRILTTHTGSLPRPPDLIRTMFAREEGVPVDGPALGARIRTAVAEVVRKQVDAGIAIVNDGEVSKPSYATYVKDRLTGFGGTSQALLYQDLVYFPEMAKRVFGDPGRSRRKTPACTGPITVRDPGAAQADVDNLKAAVAAVAVDDVFVSAASPGVISLFFRDDHYGSHEAYLFAIADAMRHEYETVARGGFILQLDCPDPARARVEGLRAGEAAAGQDHHPRGARFHDQLHRAPRAGGRADRALRAPGRPRERHCRNRLRLRHLGGPGRGRPRHRLGEARQPGRGRPAGVSRALVAPAGFSSGPPPPGPSGTPPRSANHPG